jgi:PAS domain S-box-containing protein
MKKSLEIRKKLIAGFGAITFLILILGIGNIFQTRYLEEITNNFYNHPFAVSNALQKIHIKIIDMNLNLISLANAGDSIEIDKLIDTFNKNEQFAIENIDLVKKIYLGDLNDVEVLMDQFMAWKFIRDSVIFYARSGNHQKAFSITTHDWTPEMDKLIGQVHKLEVFADNKAIEFINISGQSNKQTEIFVVFIVCAVLTAIILLSVSIYKYIIKSNTDGNKTLNDLEKSKLLLESSIESPKDMIILSLDVNYNYLYFNNTHMLGMEQVYGTKPEIGKCIFDYMTLEEDIEKAKDHYKKALLGESHMQIDKYGYINNSIYFETRYNSILDKSGKIIGVTAFAQDVTARKRLEKERFDSENKFKALVEQSLTGIYIIDEEAILYVNNQFCEIFGYSEAELLNGIKPTDLIQKEDINTTSENVSKRLYGEVNSAKYTVKGKRKDGRILWIENHGSHINLEGKEVITGTILDITKQKKSEQKLKTSEKFSKEIIESMSDGFSILGENGVHLNINRAFCKMTGFSKEELIGIGSPHPYWPEEEYPKIQKAFVKASHGNFESFELVFKRKDGKRFPVRISPSQIIDEKGQVVSNYATITDISKRKHFENQLIASEQKFRNAITYAPYPIMIHADGKVLQLSKEWIKQSGYTIDDIPTIKKWSLKAYGKDAIPSNGFIENLYNIEKPQSDGEWKVKIKDGSQKLWNFSSSPIGKLPNGKKMVISMASDITESKQAELALIQSESLLKQSQKAAKIASYSFDAIKDNWTGSEELDELFGINKNFKRDIANWKSLIHPDDKDLVFKHLLNDVFKNHKPFNKEYRIIRKSKGNVVWVHGIGKLYFDDKGNVTKMIGTIQDITERKRNEQNLVNEKILFESIIDRIPIMLTRYEPNAQMLFLNREFEKKIGWKTEEVQGFDMMDKVYPDPEVREQAIKYMEKASPDWKEFPLVTKSGEIINSEWSNIKLADGTQIGIGIDNSERKKLENEKLKTEAQLRHNQKLESIGTLAGGVAHEINNPINGIMNYAQLIEDKLDVKSDLIEYTHEITKETKRISAIVKNLLAFSRDEKETHSLNSLTDIVDSTISLIKTVIRHDNIELKIDIPELPGIKCRNQQIRQIIMNFLTNARDALNEKYAQEDKRKTINITARKINKDNKHWIRTTVEDNGTGISDQVKNRIFDPFYTTKEKEKGTGLGLSISHRIAKDHHGDILVESKLGKYTKIHLDLPVDNGWGSKEKINYEN